MRVMPREWISNPETAVAFAEATGKPTTQICQNFDLAARKTLALQRPQLSALEAPYYH